MLGHHPHIVQPIEHYRTRRGENRIAVVAYSLGGLEYRRSPHRILLWV
ncbi:hypothetical protein CK231_22315 [Mesorhizobium loti]|nr:hypothetical protein CK231_22315 [Mesorhizobium loti]PBC07539.1 hypothetical protein CK230_26120 [Mesorhizobium sp. WSM3859]